MSSLDYSEQLEKEACVWVGSCINKTVPNYESLGNGIDLLNMLSALDSETFDIKKVWKFATKNKEEDANTFRWKNLNLLEESIANCWDKNTGKNVYEIYKVEFLEIIKSSKKTEIHQLFIVVCATIVMLSEHNDRCFLLLEKLNENEDSESALKNLLSELVNKISSITGTQIVEKPDSPTPGQGAGKSAHTRRREISAEYHNPDMYQTFEKINNLERDLIYYKDLVMTQKQQLDDCEDRNQALQRELKSKSDQLSHLSLINESFKEKANIGMLEFLEMELKSKESQLVTLHSRLDEKQKEYSTKLENYQKMFKEQQQRAAELEQENSDLSDKVNELSKLAGGNSGSQDSGKRDEEFALLEKELLTEKEKNKKLKDDCFKDKGLLMQQEIKMSVFEQNNAELQLRVGELESKIEEYESQVKRLETFSNDSDVNGKVNKIFSLLHSVQHESLKSNVEHILHLLKQWSDSVLAPKPQPGASPAEEMGQLRLENSELKKSLKELKQAFVSQLPNPSEEDLGRQRADGGSSMVAQQLLKKVRIFEEQNNQLKAEKKQMMENMLQNSRVHMEHVNLLYAVALDRLVTN